MVLAVVVVEALFLVVVVVLLVKVVVLVEVAAEVEAKLVMSAAADSVDHLQFVVYEIEK